MPWASVEITTTKNTVLKIVLSPAMSADSAKVASKERDQQRKAEPPGRHRGDDCEEQNRAADQDPMVDHTGS